jgi:S-adenosylmethionine:tRNA ribosyltransferase-isomerase
MQLSEFVFPFDPTLIADRPCEPRDQARLLVAGRRDDKTVHRRVKDLPDCLQAGDLLVVNDTKVMPVRFHGRKQPGGGRMEVTLIRRLGAYRWEALIRGRIQPGQRIELGPDTGVTLEERTPTRTVVLIDSPLSMEAVMNAYGQMPLPPYVKRSPVEADRQWYQTIFARDAGAIAAPTAGLHFTEAVLHALRAAGIGLATVTLHVGMATFKPVTMEDVTRHEMPPEPFWISEKTCEAIATTKARGSRVVAVGTTVVRALESAAARGGALQPCSGETTLFILPGYRFRVIDALMTNFHLPRTTLIMLVAAFAGRERLFKLYEEAIRERYRFYSYGDAMLLL